MKNILGILLVAGSLAQSGCDKIASGDRLIAVETVASDHTILLTEFTGWQCLNCPKAAAAAKKLMDEYEGKVMVVGMHSYNNSFNEPGTIGPDFRTEEALAYSEYFGVSSLPVGTINQKVFNGNILQDYTAWIACAQQEIQVDPDFMLRLSCTQSEYNARVLQIETTVTRLGELTGLADNPALKLQIWVTESNIIAPQILPNGQINNTYVHNHVLRGAINGTWGESIDLIYEKEMVKTQISYRLDSAWKPENCSIIAFVYRDDTKAVLQSIWLNIGSPNL